MKKVAVTGGAGFVGSGIINHLSKAYPGEYKFLCIDDFSSGSRDNITAKDVEIAYVDITDVYATGLINTLAAFEPDVVFHLAAIAPLPDCQADPIGCYTTNTLGTVNVIETCRKLGIGDIVFASTSAVYENQSDLDHTTPPDLNYSTSKWHCEHIINNYRKNYGMDISILRLFNVYGPNQDYLRKHPPFIGYLFKCLHERTQPKIYCKAGKPRNYVFSYDVAEAFHSVAHTTTSSNVTMDVCGDNAGYTTTDIIKTFYEVTNFDLEVEYGEPGELWSKYTELFEGEFPLDRQRVVRETYKVCTTGNASDARIDWTPRYNLYQGLAEMYSIYKQSS